MSSRIAAPSTRARYASKDRPLAAGQACSILLFYPRAGGRKSKPQLVVCSLGRWACRGSIRVLGYPPVPPGSHYPEGRSRLSLILDWKAERRCGAP